MPFTYINNRVSYNPAYIPTRFTAPTTTTPSVTTDSIRPVELYVESDSDVEKGHLVQWTGEAAMFTRFGERIDSFNGLQGHEYALGKVESAQESHSKKVSGVVIDTAALPDSTVFLHKGVHSNHNVSNAEHILRVGVSGSVVLAWVLDAHENKLEGLYDQNMNGTFTQLYVVRELGEDHFSMEPVSVSSASLEDQIAELTARLDELTADN